jgi:hypothetical protein
MVYSLEFLTAYPQLDSSAGRLKAKSAAKNFREKSGVVLVL